jgi:hypothetical protein
MEREGVKISTLKANSQINFLWQKAENLSKNECGEFMIIVVAATQI